MAIRTRTRCPTTTSTGPPAGAQLGDARRWRVGLGEATAADMQRRSHREGRGLFAGEHGLPGRRWAVLAGARSLPHLPFDRHRRESMSGHKLPFAAVSSRVGQERHGNGAAKGL
jgi:hypothetical protein